MEECISLHTRLLEPDIKSLAFFRSILLLSYLVTVWLILPPPPPPPKPLLFIPRPPISPLGILFVILHTDDYQQFFCLLAMAHRQSDRLVNCRKKKKKKASNKWMQNIYLVIVGLNCQRVILNFSTL